MQDFAFLNKMSLTALIKRVYVGIFRTFAGRPLKLVAAMCWKVSASLGTDSLGATDDRRL